MNTFQPTSFKTVGAFLDYLPEEELEIVDFLRTLVFKCIPDCREKLSYNVPFYYRNSRICYIWPASVPWGGVDAGVAVGFCKGHLLSDDAHYLVKKDRKQIYTKTFTSIEQIEVNLLSSYLFEAREIDEHPEAFSP